MSVIDELSAWDTARWIQLAENTKPVDPARYAAALATARAAFQNWIGDGLTIQLAVWSNRLKSLTAVGAGETAAAAGMVVAPIAAFFAGCYALFFQPYRDAEETYAKQEMKSGYTHGFVAALIKWEWRQLFNRFGRGYIRINVIDDEMNKIRVVAYNLGLLLGYMAGITLPPDTAKAVLQVVRKAANEPAPADWNRQTQISYVITLGAAAQRAGVILPG